MMEKLRGVLGGARRRFFGTADSKRDEAALTEADPMETFIDQSIQEVGESWIQRGQPLLLMDYAIAPPLPGGFDQGSFLQEQPWLEVYPYFLLHLLPSLSEAGQSTPMLYLAAQLTDKACNGLLLAGRPLQNLSVLPAVSFFLKKQHDGTPGLLLTNGFSNLFYVADAQGTLFVIFVRWSGKRRIWKMDGWRLSDEQGEWDKGHQVLFPCRLAA